MKKIPFFLFFITLGIIVLFFLTFFPKKSKLLSPISSKITYYPQKPKRSPITLSSVYNKLPTDPKQPVKINPDEYILIVTGDIIPGRSVNWKMTKLNNFRYPFEKTVEILKSGDLVFINLEAPLILNCPLTVEGMNFCGNPKFIEGLKFASIDIVNIANNHFENYGVEGTESTINLLEKNNILVAGNEKKAIKQIKNKKFGFLGFNFISGGTIAQEKEIRSSILDLKSKVDFLIVMYHWGEEYTYLPNESQKKLAYLTIDAGADIVVGNHPHWIGAMEIYNEKPIVYSHGNFIFDQMWSLETREGIIGKYVFDSVGVKEIFFYPVIIEDYSQPRFANIIEAKKILDKMKENSEKLRF